MLAADAGAPALRRFAACNTTVPVGPAFTVVVASFWMMFPSDAALGETSRVMVPPSPAVTWAKVIPPRVALVASLSFAVTANRMALAVALDVWISELGRMMI